MAALITSAQAMITTTSLVKPEKARAGFTTPTGHARQQRGSATTS